MERQCVNQEWAEVLFLVEVRNTSQVLVLLYSFVLNLLPFLLGGQWPEMLALFTHPTTEA